MVRRHRKLTDKLSQKTNCFNEYPFSIYNNNNNKNLFSTLIWLILAKMLQCGLDYMAKVKYTGK